MMLFYACTIFFTVMCDSFPLELEYTPNVGTVLFSFEDMDKKQWSKNEIGLLKARRYFQNLLPPPMFINCFNEDQVSILLEYFRDAYAAIKREAKDPEADTILTTALSDAVGGYFKEWILPIAKLDYYGGTISQTNVIKLFQFYNEIKRYLDTNGEGWRNPDERVLNTMTINVLPPQVLTNTRCMKDPCDLLAYFEKTPTGLSIPIPSVSWNNKWSLMFVPLKNASLITMNSPDLSQNLLKYYHAARSCIRSINPRDQRKFDEKFQSWLIDDVVPHLKDDNLYLALGSVLSLVNTSQNVFTPNIIDLYFDKCKQQSPVNTTHTTLVYPMSVTGISCKKLWIIIIILLIEIAWCVPALIYIICSKKFKKKERDCSSNFYFFIGNGKKKCPGEAQTLDVDVDTSCCLGDAKTVDNTMVRIFNESQLNNAEFMGQYPSCTTNTIGTTCLSCSKCRPKIQITNSTKCACNDPKTFGRNVSKKSSIMTSLRQNSSTQMTLSSYEICGAKPSGASYLTMASKHYSPPPLEIHQDSRKRQSEYAIEGKSQEDLKRTDDRKPNERRQSVDHKKSETGRHAEESKRLEERRQTEQNRILPKHGQFEESKKPKESRFAEEYGKLEGHNQDEEYWDPEDRKQDEEDWDREERMQEECGELEERKRVAEFWKIEEQRQADQCTKPEERRQSAKSTKKFVHLEPHKQAKELRKPEEYCDSEECRKFKKHGQAEESRKLKESIQTEEYRKLDERRQTEIYRKLEERRQAEVCRKHEKRKQAEQCKKLNELRQAEENKKLEERRQAEENKKLEERRQGENNKKLDERRQAEECKKLKEQKKAEEKRKLEERKQAEECRKLKERQLAEENRKLKELKQAEENRKLKERKQAEENKKHEERKLAEENRKLIELKQAEECKKVKERKQAEENQKLEECKQAEECKKLKERKQAEECRKLKERQLAEECKKLEENRQAEENIKLEEIRQVQDCRSLYKVEESRKTNDSRKLNEHNQLDELRKLDESRKQQDRINLQECRRRKKAELNKNLKELRELEEYTVYKYKEMDESLGDNNSRQFEEYSEFYDNLRPGVTTDCDRSCLNPINAFIDQEVNYENLAVDENDNYDDTICCSTQDDSQETDTPTQIDTCTGCTGTRSEDVDYENVSQYDVSSECRLSDNNLRDLLIRQGEKNTRRFQVSTELTTRSQKGSKICFDQPFLEITIDRPGTEISVDMSQCRTHSHPHRPSKIPKLATCTLHHTSTYILRKQPTLSHSEKHRSLIPQPKKKTADDMDLPPSRSSELNKLNVTF